MNVPFLYSISPFIIGNTNSVATGGIIIVPEPCTLTILLISLLSLPGRRRR